MRSVQQILQRGTVVLATVILTMMMLSISFDVFLRYVFSESIRGSYEVTTLILMPALLFLPLASTIEHGSHPRVMIVHDRLPESMRRLADAVTLALSLTLWSLIGWAVFLRARDAIVRNEVAAGGVNIPAYYAYLIILFGCLGAVVALLLRVASKRWEWPSSESPQEPSSQGDHGPA